MTDDAQRVPSIVDFQVGEMTDLLDAGSVGLYEFVDELRGDPDLPEAEMTAIAGRVLQSMLADPEIRLVWKRWADPEYTEDAIGIEPCPQDWLTPTDEPHLAVTRTEQTETDQPASSGGP